MKAIRLLAPIVAVFVSLNVFAAGELGEGMPEFRVRDGYRVSLASEPLEEARFIEFDDHGTLYVSQPRHGKIVALRDKNNDGVYETVNDFVTDKKTVHGMHYYKGWLWFTVSQGIYKGRDTNGDGKADEVVTIIKDGDLPGGKGHWWRPIFVTGDGFYTSIGDVSNISEEQDTDRKKLWFYSLDGKQRKLIASGIRNTEKYRYRPGTTEIWGPDHNSDWYGKELGEDESNQPVTNQQPPGEFNKYVEGGFYGHPFIVGDKLPRLEFLKRPDILELAAKTISPEWLLPSHAAVNGFCFVDSVKKLPKDHLGDAFLASHGSWNRSVRVGYSIIRVLFDDQTGKPYGSLDVVSTLKSNDVGAKDRDGVLGRPVDCTMAPDGSILFSCDYTNQVYRIEYIGGETEIGQ
ncbi:MAG: hypothetical protein GC154_10480 [bacterium]|nr:hypothetical protein [bacterium]